MPHFAAADGTELYYEDSGSGPAVLALSGLTRNLRDFDFVAPHLSHLRLIRMDYRGRGQSGWTDPSLYSIPQEAADALALLDHLSLPSAAILGTSRGGLIGLFIGATQPQRLTGLALNDIGPELTAAGLADIAAYIGKRPAAPTLDAAARALPKSLHGFANVPHDRWLEMAGQLYAQSDDGLTLRYDPALADAFRAAYDPSTPPPDAWPLFHALPDIPLALIRGANSPLLSQATATTMRTARPDMLFADVPDRGHVPFLDEPAALATLTEWSQRLP
jgi:pimeloyl-ACP methyl ester carboxylesterase